MLKGIHLTLLVGPVVPVPVPAAILDALDSVEVTSTAEHDTPSGFRLTFTVSTRSPLHTVFLLGAGAIVPILRVILIATVNGMPEVLVDGVITRQDMTPGENGKATLTITGTDLTALMDRFDLSGFLYPAMPPNIQVMMILAKYAVFGMIPAVLPPLFVDVPIPTDRIPAQDGTDLYYIRKLARDVGYVFYLVPGPVPGTNTAYWGPEVKIGVPQPALNLDLDAGRNVESLNFRFNNDAKSLPIVYLYIKETQGRHSGADPGHQPVAATVRADPAAADAVQPAARYGKQVLSGCADGGDGRERAYLRRGDRVRLARTCCATGAF